MNSVQKSRMLSLCSGSNSCNFPNGVATCNKPFQRSTSGVFIVNNSKIAYPVCPYAWVLLEDPNTFKNVYIIETCLECT